MQEKGGKDLLGIRHWTCEKISFFAAKTVVPIEFDKFRFAFLFVFVLPASKSNKID